MKVLDTTLRDWLMRKSGPGDQSAPVSPTQPTPERNPRQTRPFQERSGLERRAEAPDMPWRGKDWRRRPERRLPDVGESTLEEFNRWRNSRQ